MEEATARPFDAELWLRSLAGDILEHERCESCRINAAEALARLGSIEETLRRLGIEDPRDPRAAVLDEHRAQAVAGRPPHVRLDLEADIVVREPSEEFQARISSAVQAAVEKAIKEFPGATLAGYTGAVRTHA